MSRFTPLALLLSLVACSGGLTGPGAIEAPAVAADAPDGRQLPPAVGQGAPMPGPAAAAPEMGLDTNTAYYYLPGPKAPRIAAAPGGSGILSAPADDERLGANCGREIRLHDPNSPEEPLHYADEHTWTLREGKGLSRRLLVSRPGDGPAEDAKLRVFYERAAGPSVQYRDYLLPKLGAESQEIEIAVDNPQSGDAVKVFYVPNTSHLDPQSKLYRSCAYYRFEGFAKDWTEGSYADYDQGPKDRIYVNQAGHFLVKVVLDLQPDRSLKPVLYR